ncbi:MAG: LLM class flavin-dependent oxidoreductase [Paracoccaceae bacterium]|nr:LLM class flavin-dependent oxidoreductase [Paracoccaceae bacterium]
MTPMTCVVIGNEALLVHCSERLLERGHKIAAVVTRDATIMAWAEGRGLRVVRPGRGLAEHLAGVTFDWLLSIANLDIIPEAVLAMPSKGAVNFHDGPLPRHAGLNAPVWAMIAGETQHGITWHMIEGRVDEGDILVMRMFDITAQDTALTLNTKAFEAAMDSFPELMAQLESGDLRRSAQDLAARSYHAWDHRPHAFGVLDFARPAAELERLVRALDHGDYFNPLCAARFLANGALWLVGAARVTPSHATPGTVIEATPDHLTVACGQDAIVLSGLQSMSGTEVAAEDIAPTGTDLSLTPEMVADLEHMQRLVEPHVGFWRKRLAGVRMVDLPGVAEATGARQSRPVAIPAGPEGMALVAAAVAQLARQEGFDLAYSDDALHALAETSAVFPWLPLAVDTSGSLSDLAEQLRDGMAEIAVRVGFSSDLPARVPELDWPATPSVAIVLGQQSATIAPVMVRFGEEGVTLDYDDGAMNDMQATLFAARLEMLAAAGNETRIAGLPRLPEAERELVLNTWNATATDHDRTLTMHRAFEAQVARTPDAAALVFEGHSLSYAELNARANRAAHVLREMGVGPDRVVGLFCHRSVDLMVGALAILKAGGAYLPLDPAYPADRLRHYLSDSQASVVVTQSALKAALPDPSVQTLVLDADPRLSTAPDGNLPDTSGPEDLAYLIYTSGSTGTPKGVMIEHRNVMNFYTGMDAHVPRDPPGTWLAVTSLSFDISVLELFYTTARGFKVVLTSDEDRGLISNGPMAMSDKGMEFSVYYWGNDDGVGRDKYRLLLEGAKFADENGFVAVWTPERHFHAFGGPYPNPSVTGAAVAAVTRNIGVRAGSVVSPLHHPARIAEEWAVIDNLTNGRAGMAIASGWQPDDFVLRPENTPPDNKPMMTENIHQLRKLWKGEPVAFPCKDGTPHEVITQPRPVSKELPIWVTTAGNPATWKEAGELGCNVLTHLLGQSIDEVAGKIKLYHDALRAAGYDPATRTVTLMLHTCLADSREAAREIAREPMKDYLRSAAGLIKQYAWVFPAFKRPEGVKNAFDLQLTDLSDEDMEGILDFAFERYFNDSGLFGTVEDALARTEELKRIGVNEIACLIDYGIPADQVLEGLKPLARVVQAANVAPELAEDDFSIAAQIVRHEVSHLQCTPSMARMIAMNDEARFALSKVQHLFLGGEPLPGALVREFAEITGASVTNMYGPTETTIWSSVAVASAEESVVNIGAPLANQQLYVLDAAQQPVPLGVEGELWIGGEGVTRGYWHRAEQTAERFVDNPFHPGRMYRTGDLVRRRADGRIDFLGRVDHQVKLRGHRIELGEIEAALEALPQITQAVVVAREDQPGDVRLVGYYTGADQDEAKLKAALSAELPAIMVPGRYVHLTDFPLTPNKKVDRGALPAPAVKTAPTPRPAEAEVVALPAAGDPTLEPVIAQIWTRVLGVETISGQDHFFELGGHSLLAVQAHRAMRDELGAKGLSITDVFRFPILSDLAARVASLVETKPAPTEPLPAPANDRAQARSEAMARRRAMRARRSA